MSNLRPVVDSPDCGGEEGRRAIPGTTGIENKRAGERYRARITTACPDNPSETFRKLRIVLFGLTELALGHRTHGRTTASGKATISLVVYLPRRFRSEPSFIEVVVRLFQFRVSNGPGRIAQAHDATQVGRNEPVVVAHRCGSSEAVSTILRASVRLHRSILGRSLPRCCPCNDLILLRHRMTHEKGTNGHWNRCPRRPTRRCCPRAPDNGR
jgi:hypothetical protein